MLTLYRAALYLAFPLFMLRLFYRALRDRRYFANLPQRLGWLGFHPPPGGIWIHAVSVGEVNAATPLIHALLENVAHKPILLTTMTPTGADRVTKTFGGRVAHCHLPYDYPGAARRFLERVQPCLAVVMETEIWPNLIASCHRRGIPMLYANVRLSKRSYRGYRRVAKLIRPTLAKINCFAVQTEADAERLRRLGAPKAALTVTGNLKFDMEVSPDVAAAAKLMRNAWGRERLVWVAGSTHDGEEAQILAAFARLRAEFQALLLVIVPRHPHRFAAVFRRCARQYNTVLRSQNRHSVPAEAAVYVADTMGELPMLLAAADVAFIGGSLKPFGGHNVLEAAAAGVAVVFGRHMFNFAEIADLLVQHSAGLQVMHADELTEVMQRLLDNPLLREQYGNRGRELVEKNRGALQKVRALIAQTLAG